jgi:hypothetical protein
MPEQTIANMHVYRIAKALDFALRYGGIDGDHHKTWVIDQMVRALTGSPMVNYIGTDCHGQKYECDVQGASDEYIAWVRNACSGADGPNTYDWDVGVPP